MEKQLKNGYKNTEVGVIPSDWEVGNLGEISNIKTGPFGSSLHEKDYVIDGTPIITVEHLSDFGIVHHNMPMVSDFDRKRLDSYSMKLNDIVFSRVGSVDRNSIVSKKEEGWLFSGRLLRIRIENKNTEPKYLSYYFQQETFKQRVKSVAVGQTMPSLNTQILKGLSVILPPLKEQKAIANALSDADVYISSLEELIQKKQNIKQAAMQKLLKPKKDWEIKILGEIVEMYSGGTPLTSKRDYYKGNIPWVVIADITKAGKYIYETEKTISNEGVLNSSAKVFKKGVLLFAMYASIGKTTIAMMDTTCNQAILGIQPHSIETQYLYYFLAFHERKFATMGQTGTQSNLSKDMVQKIEVPIPPTIEEQTQIATILSDMDNELEILEEKLQKAEQLKQGMMQNLLTGKIRLL